MRDKPSFYATIPAHVRYADITPNAKLLYAEITALLKINGICFATNRYFSKLFNKNKVTISRWISELKENKFINVHYTYKNGTKEIDNRYIEICYEGLDKNNKQVLAKMLKNNINTNNNNTTYINKGRFTKPNIELIAEYCKKRNNNIDPQSFFDFYESKGWKIGANKMKDWKAAIRTWESRNKNKPQTISKIKNQLHTHKKAKEIINKINNK